MLEIHNINYMQTLLPSKTSPIDCTDSIGDAYASNIIEIYPIIWYQQFGRIRQYSLGDYFLWTPSITWIKITECVTFLVLCLSQSSAVDAELVATNRPNRADMDSL